MSAQTHKPVLVPGGPNRTKMFHVKHFGTIAGKNLTRHQTAASFDHVRSINFLARFQKRGGGASMA